MMKLAALLVFQCTLCVTIRVPVVWNNDSEVNNNDSSDLNEQDDNIKVVPKEYFEYTAAKPQFAIDVASFHGVKSPEEHYSAYPIAPHTGVSKPSLGYHQLHNPEKNNYHPYQGFVNKSSNYVKPASTFFDVYHPYKSEEPALQTLYKDPVLNRIKNDIRDSKNRLQKYETNAGEPNIKNDEYLDNPEQIDYKQTAQKNIPVQFELHQPLRRPIYYKPLQKNHNRLHILNQKLKHPWNQNYVKVTPIHYKPVQNHLQHLRQQHAIRYDDEHNQYPQLPQPEALQEQPDGYDIYEKAKSKFVNLRNNVDESVNKAALESKASGNYKLELQDDDHSETKSDDHQDDEFVPVKNYAQVRKTETTKHVPREIAFQDAESYEDLINAPRLREAVKSTKAQIVYSEEGYEDSAYDHAGEQKHASDHEGHGGYLKEDEASKGKYKIPSVSTSHDDINGSEYRDKTLHGEKWKNDDKVVNEEKEDEDYSEDEYENTANADVYAEGSNINEVKTDDAFLSKSNQSSNNRLKVSNDTLINSTTQHELSKREIPLVDSEISNVFLSEDQTDNINKTNHNENKTHNSEVLKYPYYFAKDSTINKDSPLRYAENLKLIPKKTHGGTEFYNSRSNIECSEVEDDVDPVPEKLKTGESPENDNDTETEPSNLKNKQRLNGLGDKIDCFKAKYFGENPLDSPFFKEDIIANPNPLTIPNLEAFGTKYIHKHISQLKESQRKKRSAPFVYEPYKIIRESQVPDSKKTTTSSNISPLIKQLQSSRVIDKTNSKHNSDPVGKKNSNLKVYTDIDKENRQKHSKSENKEVSDKSFVDVNVDQRRGEPRYEIQHQNHKAYYTPVENKTALSFQDYKEKMDHKTPALHQNGNTENQTSKDEDEYEDDDEDAEEDVDDDYEEYDSDEDEKNSKFESTTTTTTSTTRKPISRIRKTTQNPILIKHKSTEKDENDYIDNKPKLQLITRFKSQPIVKSDEKNNGASLNKYHEHESNIDNEDTPKYREKKKKLTKSTLVTDTTTYGEGNDDMRKEDIDAMIGVKQPANDYMPSYEKKKQPNFKSDTDEELDGDDYYKIKNNSENEDDDEEEDDGSEEEDDDDDDDDEGNNQEDDSEESYETDATTPEPTKKTLPSTAEKIVSTTELINTNIDSSPKISRKRIEIHKELPVNKSSPNITQYKQDIKEIEIIKEVPSRQRKKNQKNVEVLDLYKDINLAKDVNKLGGVEVFKENLDLKSGPRHGGNYRSIESEKLNYASTHKPNDQESNKDDVEASQSETNRYLEVGVIPSSRKRKMHRSQTNLRSPRNDKVKNAKLIELTDVPDKSMHGGNFKLPQNRGRERTKSAKYIELEDEDKEEPSRMHGGNFKSYGTKRNDMHGGNYRSERLRQAEDKQDSSKDQNDTNALTTLTTRGNKNNAAVLLNGYVRAMPVLTTTPNYIVDPSKRRYYYVDA